MKDSIDKIETRCEDCDRQIPSHRTIHYGDTILCDRCMFNRLAREAGLQQYPEFEPVILKDFRGHKHEFHFICRLAAPTGIVIYALEIKKGRPEGYQFGIAGAHDADVMELFSQLYARIRKGLGQQHLKRDRRFGLSIKDMNVRGRIEWDDKTGGELPSLIIDGQDISWREFGRMMMSFEGWHFKLEIFDRTEEIP
jgi:hypothetical protein